MKNRISSLLRISQWYKNIIIFFAIFLAGKIFEINALITIILGFFVLCLISSAGYIVNDVVDIERDKLHPEKRFRALASGEVSKSFAITVAILLIIISFAIAYYLNPVFTIFPTLLLISYLLYTLYFKYIAILNLYFIAFNHLLRAIAGAFLISVVISPWFILFIFLLAMFLPAAKRRADLSLLGKDAEKHSKIYLVYNKDFLDWLVIILLNSMLISYILYSFLAYSHPYFMLTIPFASFIIFRYLYFISIDHKMVRKTEYFFLDKQMLIGLLLWLTSAFIIIYLIGY